jgi:ankyrin repeat protein
MMSIFLTQKLEEKSTGNIIYNFCNAQDEKRNSATAILRSLAYQVVSQTPSLIKHTLPFFESPERTKQTLSSIETLWIIFQRMVADTDFPLTYCVLDGLDECEDAGLRVLVPKIIEHFSSEVPSTTSLLRMVIVSRAGHYLNGLSSFEQIRLDFDNDKAINNDVEQFIRARVGELAGLDGFNSDIQEHIQSTLLERANGTFLWVGFAMTELKRQKTCSQVISALEEFPLGLSPVYARIIHDIPEEYRKRSFKILSSITLAFEKLSLAQLAKVIGLTTSASIICKEQSIQDAVGVCGPILKMQDANVNLIHTSAREYLLRTVVDPDPVLEQSRVIRDVGHLEMARACIECISQSSLQFSRRADDCPDDDPLLEYAILHLLLHLMGSGDLAYELYRSFDSFFLESSKLRDNWWHAFVSKRAKTIPSLHSEYYISTLLSFPALAIAGFWVPTWAQAILAADFKRPKSLKRVDEKNSEGYTALYYMCLSFANDNEGTIAKMLIKSGANPDVKNNDGETMLFTIAKSGHEAAVAAVKILIDGGADVDAWTTRPWGTRESALHVAARHGNEAIVRVLLESGVNIHSRTSYGNTVLSEAVSGQEPSMVTLLIDNGANIHARNYHGNTALARAAAHGDEKMVLFLLDCGANINTVNTIGISILGEAAGGGHEAVVRLLIERGARINDGRGRLTHAALIFHDGEFGCDALCRAAMTGQAAIVKLLLEKGAHPKSMWNHDSAKKHAAEGGHNEVVQLLDTAITQHKR